MENILLATLLQVGAATAEAAPRLSCPNISATTVIERLSDLPPDIRSDLTSIYRDMGERSSPLLQTDAPSAVEKTYPTSRFFQAMFIKNFWLVQYELTYGGRRTLGYIRGTTGRYQRSPGHYFSGPFCATIEAVLNGVSTPGGLNFSRPERDR